MAIPKNKRKPRTTARQCSGDCADDGRVAFSELRNLEDEFAVPPLIAALNDPESQLRLMVIQALMDRKDPRVIGPLIARPHYAGTFYCQSTRKGKHVILETPDRRYYH